MDNLTFILLDALTHITYSDNITLLSPECPSTEMFPLSPIFNSLFEGYLNKT